MTNKKLRWVATSMALSGVLLLGACATDDDPGTGTTLPGAGTTMPGLDTTTTLPGGTTTSTVGS